MKTLENKFWVLCYIDKGDKSTHYRCNLQKTNKYWTSNILESELLTKRWAKMLLVDSINGLGKKSRFYFYIKKVDRKTFELMTIKDIIE